MSAERPIVETTLGQVQGVRAAGTRQYRGVPYAASTAGANRFRAPQPRTPWDGVLDASDWGPMVNQLTGSTTSLHTVDPVLWTEIFGADYGQIQDEDCLTLHIWEPDRAPVTPRPVMVWIHGGGFDHGTSATSRTDGSALADRHDVVVVSISHRLGALAYLYLPDVDGESADSVNAGMLDLVAALGWVQENIRAFGGDPGNVTVFGESGGGMKIGTLMGMPSAEGLFHKAIVQSGPGFRAMSPDDARAATHLLLERVGVAGADTREQLDALSPDVVVAAQKALVESGELSSFAFSPVVDGTVLTVSPIDAAVSGWGARVPMIIGATENEWGTFLSKDPSTVRLTDEGLLERVAAIVGEDAASVVAAYRTALPGASAGDIWVRIFSQRTFGLPSYEETERRAHAGAAASYEYVFAWVAPTRSELGAFHGLETSFAFDTTEVVTLTHGARGVAELANQLSTAWATFARTGDPNHPGLPTWPPVTVSAHPALVFSADSRVSSAPYGDLPQLWRALGTEHRKR